MKAWTVSRWQGRERPMSVVPRSVLVALVLALALQMIWHAGLPAPRAHPGQLPPVPRADAARVFALGDEVALSRLAFLWLQAFDDPPGASRAFASLDYTRLVGWLDWMLALDPRADAPLMAASRIYVNVPDPGRQRQMLDFVHRRFLEAPAQRWRWMAEAALIARHRLRDLDLALRYAQALAQHTDSGQAPAWARSLAVLVLEDRCELDAARIMLGGMLANGAITDEREAAFMTARLERLEQEQGCPQTVEEQFPFLRRPAPGD